MKRACSLLLSFFLASSMAFSADAAFEKDKHYIVLEEKVPDRYAAFGEAYPGSLKAGWPECKTGKLLTGTVIAYVDGNGTHCSNDLNASYAFDGDPETYFDNFSRQSYAALILDQAYELTEIRIHPCTTMPFDTMFGMSIQGSNDGTHWVDIVLMNQDAHGKEYHIFTPQTVTDQDYIDAGYTKKKDESLFWRGTGAYSMYRYINQSGMYDTMIAEIELYGIPAEATILDARGMAALRPTLTSYKGNVNIRNVHITPENGALPGTVIGAGGTWNKNYPELAFDGNERTVYDPAVKGPECWAGLLLDEPAVITEVRVMPGRGDRLLRTEGAHVQGSNDGVTWTSLTSFAAEDCVDTQEWIIKPVTDPTPYLYVRYVSSGVQHGDAAELLFFGKSAAPTETSAAQTPSDGPAAEVPQTGETAPSVPQTGEQYVTSGETAPVSPDAPEPSETAENAPAPEPPLSKLPIQTQKQIGAGILTALTVLISLIAVFLSRKKDRSEDD
ncbi:MAG: hypothetical protein IIW31_02900 [Clostridia bacterium]|nr:hypothetical protein [Clostridia bacterium]